MYPIVAILIVINFIFVPTTNPECVIVDQMTHSAGIFIIRIFFPQNNAVSFGRGGSHLCHNHFIVILTTTSACSINVFKWLFTVVRGQFYPHPCGFHFGVHLTVYLQAFSLLEFFSLRIMLCRLAGGEVTYATTTLLLSWLLLVLAVLTFSSGCLLW